MQLSVIVPTYNRQPTLAKALDALFAQQDVGVDWDIILVDDGSTDDTADWVARTISTAPVPLTYLYQENQGPAAARNRGIRAATAPLLLIMGDDILASPHFVAQHLVAHQQYPALETAILGPLEWAPSLKVTPFMDWWLENRFNFGALRSGKLKPDFWNFYTCNISVKRRFLFEHGLFDESFHAAAYEDTELAYRLKRVGLTVHFMPQIVAYHDHATTFQKACQRMENIGKWSPLFEAKTHIWAAPSTWIRLGRFLRGWPGGMRLLQSWAERLQTERRLDLLYTVVMMYHFWQGRRQSPYGEQI